MKLLLSEDDLSGQSWQHEEMKLWGQVKLQVEKSDLETAAEMSTELR